MCLKHVRPKLKRTYGRNIDDEETRGAGQHHRQVHVIHVIAAHKSEV